MLINVSFSFTLLGCSLPDGTLADGLSPALRFPEIHLGVLDRRHPKALLHPLASRSGAHPSPLKGVEVRGETSPRVRVVLRPEDPAAHAVSQVEDRRATAGGRRRDPLGGERRVAQAHRVPDLSAGRRREFPVQQGLAVIAPPAPVRIVRLRVHFSEVREGRRATRGPAADSGHNIEQKRPRQTLRLPVL